ncbi:2-amino-4-hydroxy-6-hydroxymethyldihydropteridine diphosphokinase [Methylosoma difficile]
MTHPTTGTVTAYIGLGSNLASPAEQLITARNRINATPGITELAFSSLYHSAPMGPQDQPDYVNAVMGILTTLSPLDLLRSLQNIEHLQGRVRDGERWGARTLDLDLLIYGNEQLDLPELTIPHAGICQRAFVLLPLAEIAPDLVIPDNRAIADLLKNCPPTDIERLTA